MSANYLRLITCSLGLFALLPPPYLCSQDLNRVVYGDDNRRDIFEAPHFYAELSRSTAAMFQSKQLKRHLNTTTIEASSLSKSFNICQDEIYSDQPAAANCTGFLIGPETLVTAGHCIRSFSDCLLNYWAFDYKMDNKNTINLEIPNNKIYGCKSIIKTILDNETKNDFAIIKLDRIVQDRPYLQVRTDGKISDTSELIVIGHPSGLPTKVADKGKIRNNFNPIFFTASLDTFGGNSGSPVIDAQTGLVEGILVRGEVDYIKDNDEKCNRVKTCEENSCRGEDVTRITNLYESHSHVSLSIENEEKYQQNRISK